MTAPAGKLTYDEALEGKQLHGVSLFASVRLANGQVHFDLIEDYHFSQTADGRTMIHARPAGHGIGGWPPGNREKGR